jgi:hypothetical protein
MTRAFFYLSVCSFRNAIRARAARLREPRYAIGLVVSLGYLIFVFGRSFGRAMHRSSAHLPTPMATFLAGHQGALEIAGAVTLVLLAAIAWLLPPGSHPPLAFSRSEVQFLFPAPVTHRQLIHYKILRSQGGAAVSSLIVTLIIHVGNLSGAWMSFIGLWFVMTSVNLHLTGIALRQQSLREHGLTGIRHQWLPLTIIAGAIALIAGAVVSSWTTLSDVAGLDVIASEVERLGGTTPLRILLFPLTSLVRLPLAATPGEFLVSLPVAAAILFVNYAWVVRSDAAFEEASAAFAARQAEFRAARAATSSETAPELRRAPFALAPIGRPEVAIFWKNLVMIGRYANLTFVVRLTVVFVLCGLILSSRSRALGDVVATLALFGAGMTTAFGAQWVRSDLRRDLPHLATLRAWPVSGAAIVRGEVLAPTAVLTAVVWVLVLVALAFGASTLARTPLVAFNRVSLAIGAMVLAPGVILTQFTISNAVSAAFPAWSSAVTSRARGLDVLGQRMLTGGGTLLALALALVPAALVAGIAGFGIRAAIGVVPVVVPAVIATGMLVIENAVAIEAVGRLLDRADVATIPPVQ